MFRVSLHVWKFNEILPLCAILVLKCYLSWLLEILIHTWNSTSVSEVECLHCTCWLLSSHRKFTFSSSSTVRQQEDIFKFLLFFLPKCWIMPNLDQLHELMTPPMLEKLDVLTLETKLSRYLPFSMHCASSSKSLKFWKVRMLAWLCLLSHIIESICQKIPQQSVCHKGGGGRKERILRSKSTCPWHLGMFQIP